MNSPSTVPLVILENIIDDTDLSCLVKSFESTNFTAVINNPNLYNYFIRDDYTHKDKIDLLNLKLHSILENLYNTKIKDCTTGGVVRYTKGQNIGVHADWDPEDSYMKSKEEKFTISSIFYFNEDYTGGELIFCKDKKFIDLNILKLKPQKNTVIFFDSSKFHYTNPILSGTKYSYTNFYSLDTKLV